MKQKRKVWALIAASALIIIVVVLLVVFLPSASGTGGTPTPTYTAPLPTGTCQIYFDKASYVIENGETFTVTVTISNVNYLVAGQFDVVYDSSSLNIEGRPTGGIINDAYRSCGNISVGNGGDGVGGDYTNSGLFRVIVEVPWAQDTQDPCDGGAGTGPCGDGYLATFTFKGMKPGTSEIAFTGKKQMHQIVDWVAYQDYSYPCNPYPPVFTPTPCVPDSVLTWGGDVSVTVQ